MSDEAPAALAKRGGGAPLMTLVKEMILSGDLAAGQRVTEAALADRLNISRTPIRSLLPRLAAEGFLEEVGRRGFQVRAFTEAESWEALELRTLLEGQAARWLAQRGADPRLIIELEGCLADGDRLFEKRQIDRDDELAYGRMNGRFHDLIVQGCGSPLLQGFVERVNLTPFVSPYVVIIDRMGAKPAFDILFRAHGDHHAIVEAIKQRDGHRAETLLREHAHQQRYSLLALGSKPGPEPARDPAARRRRRSGTAAQVRKQLRV